MDTKKFFAGLGVAYGVVFLVTSGICTFSFMWKPFMEGELGDVYMMLFIGGPFSLMGLLLLFFSLHYLMNKKKA